MKNFRYAVNRFFQLPEPAHFAESLATAGSPASRAPLSGARKSEILASPTPPCKRYFDRHELRQKRRDRAGDDAGKGKLDESLKRRRESTHRRKQIEQQQRDAGHHQRAADRVDHDGDDVPRHAGRHFLDLIGLKAETLVERNIVVHVSGGPSILFIQPQFEADRIDANYALPELRLRFVNVVDLFRMQPVTEHPHGSTEREFDSLFTVDKPVIFNFHGYPWLIHKLAYRFRNHENLHVRGYTEKGNINTPRELAILTKVDRFNLVLDVLDLVPRLQGRTAHLRDDMRNAIILNMNYAHEHGTDSLEMSEWVWPY